MTRSYGAPLIAAFALTAVLMAQTKPIDYPPSKKVDVVDDYFGTSVANPYRWMEDLNGPDVKRWVDAQNAVTSKYLDTLPSREGLRKRITELWNYARVSPPYYKGGRWFYSRNTGLQPQAVILTRASLTSAETVAIDPNALSPDGSVALSDFVPSPDGMRFAYGLADGGSDWSTYHVRELEGGRQWPDTLRWVKFSTVAWTEDGKGVFYGRYPEPPAGKVIESALRDKKIYYHVLGTEQSADRLIYERPEEPLLFIDADLDETGRYLFIETNKGTSNKNELFVKDLGDAKAPRFDGPVTAVYPGHTAAYRPLGVVNGELLLLTDRDAPLKTIVSVPMRTPEVAGWRTIVPQGKSSIEAASLVAGLVAVSTLDDAASALNLYRLDGTPAGAVKMPGLGTVTAVSGRFDRSEIFYQFMSPLYPATVFQFDPATGTSRAFQPPALTFDPSQYETERVFFGSKDGTRVPMFLTHKKGMRKDGTNPTMLYGYGGFNVAIQPSYRPDVPAWLERGGVWVTASLRGGSEYGEEWHEAALFEKKQNVFDDFISAAEYLVRERYATPRTLGMMGGSNGGLLVGVVMEQRPELFAVALPAVGVMDMLRYHKFSGGTAWATEYGSSDDPKAFAYLFKYSPLHNLKKGVCYPATLVTTADRDDRVVPSHSFKFAAALQEAQGCGKPALVRIETQASHGYRPTDKRIAELADQWAFAAAHMK